MKFKSPHPSNIAFSKEIKLVLIEELDGVGNFWIEMVKGAMHWFKPGEDSPEYQLFIAQLLVAGGMAADTDHEEKIAEAGETFRQWEQQLGRGQNEATGHSGWDDLLFQIYLEMSVGIHEQEQGRNPNDAVFKMRQRFESTREDGDRD